MQNEKGIDNRGTGRVLADLARADAVKDTVEISQAARDAAQPSLTDLMNGVYAKCPMVSEVEFQPEIVMDTRRGKVRIEGWNVYLYVGKRRVVEGYGSGDDLLAAIEEAVGEYTKNHGPAPRPADAVEATNAAALADLAKLGGFYSNRNGGKPVADADTHYPHTETEGSM